MTWILFFFFVARSDNTITPITERFPTQEACIAAGHAIENYARPSPEGYSNGIKASSGYFCLNGETGINPDDPFKDEK